MLLLFEISEWASKNRIIDITDITAKKSTGSFNEKCIKVLS